jgi:hypothetical protein
MSFNDALNGLLSNILVVSFKGMKQAEEFYTVIHRYFVLAKVNVKQKQSLKRTLDVYLDLDEAPQMTTRHVDQPTGY